jgi:RNA polymerase sigma-70 factor, ECF subfamily
VVDPKALLSELIRNERTRLIAALVRRYGFDVAEECVDAAFERALSQWQVQELPLSPYGWLLSVARRRAIDRVRHEAMAGTAHEELKHVGPDAAEAVDLDSAALPDERVRLLFTCCHPAIARDAQIALSLRWLSGLSTEDVARAFCIPVATMAQRLTRAKTKIETAKIPYEVPAQRELPEREGAVLEVVYAIFNEGYVATSGVQLQRHDLVQAALQIAELVTQLLPESADAKAVFALLLLIHARTPARVSPEGELIPLQEQDRTRWDASRITQGKEMLHASLSQGAPSAYAVEAAIQALHNEATCYEATDFRQIVALYAVLRQKTDTPIICLNQIVARAMSEGTKHTERIESALQSLLALYAASPAEFETHPALFAAKADFLRRLGRPQEAQDAYSEAIARTRNEAEKRFLLRRKLELESSPAAIPPPSEPNQRDTEP